MKIINKKEKNSIEKWQKANRNKKNFFARQKLEDRLSLFLLLPLFYHHDAKREKVCPVKSWPRHSSSSLTDFSIETDTLSVVVVREGASFPRGLHGRVPEKKKGKKK